MGCVVSLQANSVHHFRWARLLLFLYILLHQGKTSLDYFLYELIGYFLYSSHDYSSVISCKSTKIIDAVKAFYPLDKKAILSLREGCSLGANELKDHLR